MNTFTPALLHPELGPGLHPKALRFQIVNFLKRLKSASQQTSEISRQDQSIGVDIVYTLLKLNSGKVALHACMTAFTINSMGLSGILLA
jgi:hypothetical protein